jgi:hypothetical protein
MGTSIAISAEWPFPTSHPIEYIWDQLQQGGFFELLHPQYLEPGDLSYLLGDPATNGLNREPLSGERPVNDVPLTTSDRPVLQPEQLIDALGRHMEGHGSSRSVAFTVFGNTPLSFVADSEVQQLPVFRHRMSEGEMPARYIPCILITFALYPDYRNPMILVSVMFPASLWYTALVSGSSAFPRECVYSNWKSVVDTLAGHLHKQDPRRVTVQLSGGAQNQMRDLGLLAAIKSLEIRPT